MSPSNRPAMKPTIFSLSLLLAGTLTALADDATVQFKIDLTKDAHSISRYVYGVNRKLEGDWAGLPLRREGGNRWTAYNWTNNASNAGSDWHFQNDGGMGNTDSPAAPLATALEN